MITIHKFPLQLKEGPQIVQMPIGSEVLCVQMQERVPTIWATVDTEMDKEPETFRMYGTGWNTEPSMDHIYIGTVQDRGGYVWHFFKQ